MYDIDEMSKWEIKDIESERYEFKARVDVLKTRFNQGSKVDEEMLKLTNSWSGEQPLTSHERQRIHDVEREILGRFKTAKGIKSEKKTIAHAQLMESLSKFVPNIVLKLFG